MMNTSGMRLHDVATLNCSDELVITFRYAGGWDFVRLYTERTKGFRLPLKGERAAHILAGLLADYVIVDWCGMENKSGSVVPFNPKTCRAFFNGMIELYAGGRLLDNGKVLDAVLDEAKKIENFRP